MEQDEPGSTLDIHLRRPSARPADHPDSPVAIFAAQAVEEVDRKVRSAAGQLQELRNAYKEARRQGALVRREMEQQRERAAPMLADMRVRAQEASQMREWTREQMAASFERVREQDREKKEERRTQRLSAADQLLRLRAASREGKLEQAFERLAEVLGVPSAITGQARLDEIVAKIQHVAGDAGDGQMGVGAGSSSIAFKLMLESKTIGEGLLMGRVNELNRLETTRAHMAEAETSALGDIIDHKHRLYELDEKVRAASARRDSVRARSQGADRHVRDVHIGSDRLVRMLSGVRLTLAPSKAPATLSLWRERVDSDMDADSDGDAADGEAAPGKDAGPTTAAVATASEAGPDGDDRVRARRRRQSCATVQITPNPEASGPPVKGSAAAIAAACIDDLCALARAEGPRLGANPIDHRKPFYRPNGSISITDCIVHHPLSGRSFPKLRSLRRGSCGCVAKSGGGGVFAPMTPC